MHRKVMLVLRNYVDIENIFGICESNYYYIKFTLFNFLCNMTMFKKYYLSLLITLLQYIYLC